MSDRQVTDELRWLAERSEQELSQNQPISAADLSSHRQTRPAGLVVRAAAALLVAAVALTVLWGVDRASSESLELTQSVTTLVDSLYETAGQNTYVTYEISPYFAAIHESDDFMTGVWDQVFGESE